MAEKKKPTGNRSEASREDRLKAALKANMARRKAQAKARSEQKDGASGDAEG
ncbi:FIG00988583: hypothetical protein [Tritonibacter mobilis]|jgi:hypothetical protein|uniref:hypothetical protein n=1 Tax=Tritonibacter mobilis TaxID=379347 RepID=UPI0001B8A95D|nr:hypothetical protein [Tritonibacter mobilis]EEW60673.1 conserved hypothetical protein [Ruegeria sp. TrichCH4B]MBW3245354.1 hypothetical protein [Epibacterium sp. DP7N7-1]MCZ4269071.1 hypothetical protein [Rhodobacteraceae bacterium G21628-S1]NKX37169.1 hypothetical protein [Rhodobacteraceae bacterium R_SAG4]NKX75981.1 hypothetical protein [Rhodobacteraceae bacterium R_SAG3]